MHLTSIFSPPFAVHTNTHTHTHTHTRARRRALNINNLPLAGGMHTHTHTHTHTHRIRLPVRPCVQRVGCQINNLSIDPCVGCNDHCIQRISINDLSIYSSVSPSIFTYVYRHVRTYVYMHVGAYVRVHVRTIRSHARTYVCRYLQKLYIWTYT